ncbi:MAG: site-2 protease family protein [Proteobacteria bacterium]|nr:site-2 protease family protein [Pseudomonadota bacterium]
MDLRLGLLRLGQQFVPFIFAVIGHEIGHGFAAHLYGDDTAKNSGRLTINPIAHIDPIGTLLFPIINMVTGIPILIGWAKPVPINPMRFRKFRPGLFWVSLAGPFANLFMAFTSSLLLCLMIRVLTPEFYFYKEFSKMLFVGVEINLWLGAFNLLPIPPLDGSKVIESMLSYPAMQKYEKIAPYSFYILLALMFTGALSLLAGPIQFMESLLLGLSAIVTQCPPEALLGTIAL